MNVGKIIKVVAIACTIIEYALLAMNTQEIQKLNNYNNSYILTILIIFIGILISNLLIYGLGDLIDTNRQILKKLNNKK